MGQRAVPECDYLDEVRSRPEWQVCDVEIVVERGKPAEAIFEFAEAQSAAYIVMATHGRSGVQRWVYGSVADKVLRAARTTVVLVRAVPPTAFVAGVEARRDIIEKRCIRLEG